MISHRAAGSRFGHSTAKKLGFKIGFNKRLPRRISPQNRARAERRINSIGHDVEFRNQQVAGSIPAGGSKTPLIQTAYRIFLGKRNTLDLGMPTLNLACSLDGVKDIRIAGMDVPLRGVHV